MEENSASPLLDVRDLEITFNSRNQKNRAVKGVSFSLKQGETLAIVGESGSGKSVTALSFTKLLPPEPLCSIEGHISYKGKDILTLNGRELRKIRGKEIAYIFQEPSTSLNPVFKVGDQIAEAVKLHLPNITDVKGRVIEALEQVGIRNAPERYHAYPHELSGGMQQRVMIAMALACEPKILVADEPTTALDVTIQKQIIDLLKDLRKQLDMSIIMITHNFGIIKDFCDRVIVMFRGRIVEEGSIEDILYHPKHPYTKALIDCIPKLGAKQHRLTTINHKELLEATQFPIA